MTPRQSHNKDADTPVEVRGYKTDPLRRGYQILWNYENIYWRALVGNDAWSLYEVLRSFCHEKNNTCYPSVNLLMTILGLKDRRALTGRVKEVKGKQYEYPGLIETLQEHQLVIAEIEGEGPTMRYIFHVNLTPDLLTGAQLNQLPDTLQKKHTELLERCEQAKRELETRRRPPKVNEPALSPPKGPAPSPIEAPPEHRPGAPPEPVQRLVAEQPDNTPSPTPREKEPVESGKFPQGSGNFPHGEGSGNFPEGSGNFPPRSGKPPEGSGNFPAEHYPYNNTKRTTTEEQESNNSNEANSERDVVVALTKLGISERITKRLVSRYSRARILEKLDFLAFLQETDPRRVTNPRGWLRRAIEEDYGPPDGYKPREQREAEAAEQERHRQEIEQTLTTQSSRPARLGAWQKWVVETRGIPEGLLYTTDQLLESLKLQMPAATYQAWVASTVITELGESQARIAVSSSRAYEWLDHRLKPKFEQSLAGIIDRHVDVTFEVIERPSM